MKNRRKHGQERDHSPLWSGLAVLVTAFPQWPPAAERPHLAYVDGLRALAALGVFIVLLALLYIVSLSVFLLRDDGDVTAQIAGSDVANVHAADGDAP